MQFDFGFRIDVGNDVGSGHFFRCLSIAEKLISQKFKVIFLVNDEQEIKKHLNGNDIPFHVLRSKEELKKVEECKKIMKNISKTIIDLPFKNGLYSKSLKNYTKIIIIDDLGNKEIFSHLLFNGSIVNEFQKYEFDEKITQVFSGPEFIILRSEFETLRKDVIINKEIKKILLIFGGNDEENITMKILPYFFDKNLDITIVLGPSYKFQNDLEKNIPKNQTIKIINNEENIAKQFSKQDLVISSSGIISYELACLGIPSILIPVDEYQIKTSSEMEKNGFGINYGFWDDNFENFGKKFSLILDYSIREKMNFSGRKLVDGKGLSRVVKNICKL